MTLRSKMLGRAAAAGRRHRGLRQQLHRRAAPLRIGVVACGYADGYPRHAPTGTPVLVDGVRTRTVGRVSMDMLTVDLTPVPAAGRQRGHAVGPRRQRPVLPIDEVARAAGTIGYELMCALAQRVPVTRRNSPAATAAAAAPSGWASARSAAPGTRCRKHGRSAGSKHTASSRWAAAQPVATLSEIVVAECRAHPPARTNWTACWAAASSKGGVVLIGGDPGIGKSTLLLQAADSAVAER
jgi:hypothetical protein